VFSCDGDVTSGGERSCILATVSLSMTFIGPSHLGQRQRSLESLVEEASGWAGGSDGQSRTRMPEVHAGLCHEAEIHPRKSCSEVKPFNELRERPTRRMLSLEEERRILDAAPVYLRVAIILLAQTGGRTYSEGFSLRWSQVDFESKLIRLNNNVKTPASAEPIPLSQYACDVLQAWRKEAASKSEICLPEPGPCEPAYFNGKSRLENNFETSWRDSVSYLQFASRLLHSSQ
jgi:integrase